MQILIRIDGPKYTELTVPLLSLNLVGNAYWGSRSDIYADIGGSDHFQDGGHGGHFGFLKI